MSGTAEPAPGFAEIVRLVAPNPGPMTLTGTNTYVVGSDPAYVVDPGPDDSAHIEAVRTAGEARGGIAGVVLTHSHHDHSAGVAALGAPLLWGEVSDGDEADVLAAATAAPGPGQAAVARILGAEPAERPSAAEPPAFELGPFTVIPTPGHARDHVALLVANPRKVVATPANRGFAVLCGDLILGEGSSIVPPAAGGGSLRDYMRSLDRLEDLGATLLAPGHGPWITDPAAKIAEYRAHRFDRERALLAALDAGERSRERLLDAAWGDVPPHLRVAASFAMQAHIEKLEAEGRMPEEGLQ